MISKLKFMAMGIAVALCGCSSVQQETPPQAPPVPVGFQQLDKGLSQTFVTCQPCAQPTQKTLWTAPAPSRQPAASTNAAPAQEASPAKPQVDKETIVATSVHFASDSAALDATAKSRLKAFCQGRMQLDGLTVTGHTDSTGAPVRNHRLAQQRARTTSQFLRACAEQQGTALHIDEQAKGACCYVAPNNSPEGRAMNRRVDVEQAANALPTRQADQ